MKLRSHSQWETYAQCGEKYRLRKIVKAPERPAAWLAQGTAVHAAIERWELGEREGGTDDRLAWFLENYDREIERAKAKEPDLTKWLVGGRTKTTDDISRRRERGAAQVEAYVEAEKATEWEIYRMPDGSPAVEVPYTIDYGEVPVIGYIDQVRRHKATGDLAVWDCKTGSRKPKWPIQLGGYALGFEDALGEHVRWGIYYMAKDTTDIGPIDLSHYTPERVAAWYRQMDDGVRAGVFLPNVSDDCNLCGVKDFCLALGTKFREFEPKNGVPN